VWLMHALPSAARLVRPCADCALSCPTWPRPQSYAAQLGEDPIVHAHLSALYDTLLEQNLIRCGGL
jgi:hypothetical protein